MDRPYAEFIGVEATRDANSGEIVCVLTPNDRISGQQGFMHGGALAALLETAAGSEVEAMLANPQIEVRPVSITVDYMRAGLVAETRASAEIVRQGDRIIHVDATAWQEEPDRPIAMARLIFSLKRQAEIG